MALHAFRPDIIGSIVSPTWEDIGQLGAIAVIRTFLNYFLEQDLDHADAAGEALEGRSGPLPPRRSRTTNPSSCSAATDIPPALDAAMVPYHRL